jgi:hypothetical protein
MIFSVLIIIIIIIFVMMMCVRVESMIMLYTRSISI